MGDNIRMDLEEIGINAGNWVDSVQDSNYWRAFVNAALNLRVPYAMELVSYFLNTPLILINGSFNFVNYELCDVFIRYLVAFIKAL